MKFLKKKKIFFEGDTGWGNFSKKKKIFFIYSLFEKKTKDMNALSKECFLRGTHTKILFAHDVNIGKNISIRKASKEDNHEYRCIVCKESVVLKHGMKNVKHWAHKAKDGCGGGTGGGGGGESIEHWNTKMAILDCLNNGGTVDVAYQCNYTNCSGHKICLSNKINVEGAKEEDWINADGTKCKYKADVMVFMKKKFNNPFFGSKIPIEVHFTNKVDDKKGKLSYFNKNYPGWREVCVTDDVYNTQIYDVE